MTFPFPAIPAGGPSADPKTVTFIDHAESTADLTAYTFAKSTGTASASRRMVVTVSGTQGTRTVSSVKIHVPDVATDPTGTSLSFVGRRQGGVTTEEMWMGLLPSGTSGEYVVTWSGAQNRCGIGIWATTGLTGNTPVDTQNWLPGAGAGVNVSITTTTDGFVIAAACSHGVVTPSSTWSSITEMYDAILEGSQPAHSGASIATTGTTLNFNHTMATGGNANAAGFAASF